MRLTLGFVMIELRNCGNEGWRIAVAVSSRVDGCRCSPPASPWPGSRESDSSWGIKGDGYGDVLREVGVRERERNEEVEGDGIGERRSDGGCDEVCSG